MGQQIPPVQFGPGLRNFESLVSIVTDPKKYAKMMEALKAQVAALNERIEVVGEVKEIQKIKHETIQDRARAVRDLELANKEAAKVRDEIAQAKLDAGARLTAREAAVAKREQEVEGRVTASEADMSKREKAVEKHNEELALQEQRIEAREAAAREKMEQAIANTERLNAAISEIKR
jgi:chromosome segregation ATPase